MSRNYRELAAQRLAELTETKLEIEQLKAEVLELKAIDADHRKFNGELREGIAYWEGAVAVSGFRIGQPIQGKGYVELTGYAGAIGRDL